MLVLDALRFEAGVYQSDFEFFEVPELCHVGLIVHFEILLQKCERPECPMTLRPFKSSIIFKDANQSVVKLSGNQLTPKFQ